MTELWLPDGVVVESVIPEVAERQLGPDDAIFISPIMPAQWGVFETPGDRHLVAVAIDFPRLRQEVIDGEAACDIFGVAEGLDGVRFPCLHGYLRMEGYHLYVPFEGAPTWWVRRARTEGFALVLPPEVAEREIPYVATGPMEQGRRLVEGESRERTGRNEPCRCGSGKKFKRCCGAVDA